LLEHLKKVSALTDANGCKLNYHLITLININQKRINEPERWLMVIKLIFN
jgi:hypothetical protein